MKKFISFILAISLVFSMTLFTASAEKNSDFLYSESETALKNLDRDIPVIEIPGFGENIYSGLDTQTEEDDVMLFGPDVGVLLKSLLKNLGGFLLGFVTRNYEVVDKYLGSFLLETFETLGCNPDGTIKAGTGIKHVNTVEPKKEYGYADSYTFIFD